MMDVLCAIRKARDEGPQLRSESIRSQLMLGFTLCSFAEQSITLRDSAHAHWIVDRLRRSTQAIAHHLDEPHYVTAAAIHELRVELQRLESCIAALEARMPASE